MFNTTICFLRVLKSASELARDGAQLFHQPDIHLCFERVVLHLGNMFKFLGHCQFLEECTTSKEIVSFHDNGFVVLRFACGFNCSPIDGCYRDGLAHWKFGSWISQLAGYLFKGGDYFPLSVSTRSFGDEF